MLSFDEIENCFPEKGASTNKDGVIEVTATWLHEFARNVSKSEREACAKVCESISIEYGKTEDLWINAGGTTEGHDIGRISADECAAAIMSRSK